MLDNNKDFFLKKKSSTWCREIKWEKAHIKADNCNSSLTLGINYLTIRKAIEFYSNSNGNIEVTFLNRVSNLLGILPRCESLFSHVEVDEFFS